MNHRLTRQLFALITRAMLPTGALVLIAGGCATPSNTAGTTVEAADVTVIDHGSSPTVSVTTTTASLDATFDSIAVETTGVVAVEPDPHDETSRSPLSPSMMQAAFNDSLVDDGTRRPAWFGLSGDLYLAVELPLSAVSSDERRSEELINIWNYLDDWELMAELPAPFMLTPDDTSIRFFDATGNGVEDIVLVYQGGQRMMGNVITLLDEGWVDTGTFMRPTYPIPGKMTITWLSYPEPGEEWRLKEDRFEYGYWDGSSWRSCEDEKADYDCDAYWTGG